MKIRDDGRWWECGFCGTEWWGFNTLCVADPSTSPPPCRWCKHPWLRRIIRWMAEHA